MRRRTERRLTTLADGTLPSRARARFLRRVWRSARLSRALEDQLLAVDVLRSLADPAPERLRAWVERSRREADGEPEPRRPPE